MNIPFKKEQENKNHYSQRGFHTVECGSNSGEGRVSNFIFLVEAGGEDSTVRLFEK